MHVRYSQYYMSKHMATYRDYQHTLVHELVHYRFENLQHGAKFEENKGDTSW
jgi:predicted metal-dependent hydrolase